MKSIIFDSGPMISLSMNNLIWILPELKKIYKGNFLITPGVKSEIIDRPLASKRFKFEALQVLKQHKENVLELYDKPTLKQKTMDLLELANNIFFAHNKNINIVQYAEIEVVSAAIMLNSEAIVIDERTTRLLIENPNKLRDILKRKLHTDIKVDKNKLVRFKGLTKNIKVLRSVELITIAYEKKLLEKYVLDIQNPRKTLLDGLLWGLKLNGCSVSGDEIAKVITLESR